MPQARPDGKPFPHWWSPELVKDWEDLQKLHTEIRALIADERKKIAVALAQFGESMDKFSAKPELKSGEASDYMRRAVRCHRASRQELNSYTLPATDYHP